jgi:NAD(P)-dependent dehydrogenase (short-subunit alcohol dehydrogenase family)
MATQSNGLSGQTALVTGATTGFGRATALQLAEDGADLIIHGRNAERGNRVVQAIVEGGGRARFVAADLGSADEAAALADAAADVDILVNNAGFSSWGDTETFDVHQFDAMYASNIRAPFILVAAVAPKMAARGRGAIINVGSMAGTVGLPQGAAYGSTKAALAALTRSWAAEYGPRGVRINTIAPGPIYTRPEARELFDNLGATTAMRRAAQPGEIAEVVSFLASPRASYITGATIAVDGGRTAI